MPKREDSDDEVVKSAPSLGVAEVGAAPSADEPARRRARMNNFDLIRLFAATEVMIVHAITYLNPSPQWDTLYNILHVAPGVPIFFFVSGFLVYQSWAKQSGHRFRNFYRNRALRLYPGLWVCFAASLLSVTATGYFGTIYVPIREFVLWIGAQLSFIQFFNPDFMRSYGSGVLNGSLWTIPVELQFYVLTPVLAWLLIRHRHWFFPMLIVFALANILTSRMNEELLAVKLLSVSFIPWIFMFMTGAFVSTNERLRHLILRVPLTLLLLAYSVSYFISLKFGATMGNEINPFMFVILACLVLKVAYTKPGTANRILRHNDISYGVYIYHMPIINLVIYLGLASSPLAAPAAFLTTLCIAGLSWKYVERPSLRRKTTSLRPV